MSDHDYPTEDELQRLRDWPVSDPRGWLGYAQSLWWAAGWGWPELECDPVSTGGWSGNESIIEAMRENVLWAVCWENTRAGGHYTFKLPGPEYFAAPEEP